jgi:hypothetical protein
MFFASTLDSQEGCSYLSLAGTPRGRVLTNSDVVPSGIANVI